MPKLAVHQTSFSAGEITPKMRGRTDVARYQQGADVMENVVPVVHGGAESRSGLRYLAVAKHAGTRKVILERFVFNVDQAFAVEFGHLHVRFYDPAGGRVLDAGNVVIELVSPYTEADLPNLTFRQGGDTLLIFCRSIRPHRLRRISSFRWDLSPVPFVVEPFGEIGEKPNFSLTLSSGAVGSRTFTSVNTSAPGVPTIGAATPLNGAVSVAFTPPANDGGIAISGYAVTSNPTVGLVGTAGTGSPILVPGLTNGVAYTFTVTATNGAGTSAPSAVSNSATPLAGLPSQTIVATVDVVDKRIDAANGVIEHITGPTASGSGGISPYSFAWEILPGSAPAVVLTTANTAQPELTSTGTATTNVAALRVTATDAAGAKGTANANLTVVHDFQPGYEGPGAPGFGGGDNGTAPTRRWKNTQ